MDVEIAVPQTPVALAPGEETRVRIEVCNRSTASISLRLSVARSRAGAWSHTDPPLVELAPGDCTALDVVFRPPGNVLPSPTLQPFTVQAEDVRYGVMAGRATGLLTVAAPERLGAVLTREPPDDGRPARYRLRLSNRGDSPLTLRLEPTVEPSGGQVTVDPVVVDVPRGETVTVQVRVRPRIHLVGSDTPYAVSVSCRDAAAAEDAPPLATVEGTGTAGPRLGRAPAAVLTVTLLVLVAAGAVVLGGLIDLPGRQRTAPPKTTAPTVDVQRPYALVDVFPRQDGPAGRPAAEATLARLTAAGMPVRLVDSTATEVVADGQGGLWVLLQDGFSSIAETRAYCDQYRMVAPKCDVIP